MHKKLIRHEISIHALTTKVWRVLTCTEYASQFLPEGQWQTSWTKGSPIMLEVENGHGRNLVKKGVIEEVVPGLSLQYTLFELGEISSHPVGFLYELIPEEGGIRLRLTQEVVSHTEDVYRVLAENCRMLLQEIKWLAEYA